MDIDKLTVSRLGTAGGTTSAVLSALRRLSFNVTLDGTGTDAVATGPVTASVHVPADGKHDALLLLGATESPEQRGIRGQAITLVGLTEEGETCLRLCRTDWDGLASLGKLAPGRYWVRADHDVSQLPASGQARSLRSRWLTCTDDGVWSISADLFGKGLGLFVLLRRSADTNAPRPVVRRFRLRDPEQVAQSEVHAALGEGAIAWLYDASLEQRAQEEVAQRLAGWGSIHVHDGLYLEDCGETVFLRAVGRASAEGSQEVDLAVTVSALGDYDLKGIGLDLRQEDRAANAPTSAQRLEPDEGDTYRAVFAGLQAGRYAFKPLGRVLEGSSSGAARSPGTSGSGAVRSAIGRLPADSHEYRLAASTGRPRTDEVTVVRSEDERVRATIWRDERGGTHVAFETNDESLGGSYVHCTLRDREDNIWLDSTVKFEKTKNKQLCEARHEVVSIPAPWDTKLSLEVRETSNPQEPSGRNE